ncbi:transcriptional regulator [Lactococcus piscium]|uniref:Transcriptional regulator n=1 Tax=Pseudolactococcus piscium TaxID=1364 RepID=A0A2A5RUG3_9LACT|nr:helix-turn-helix transcriptional regulator [Lactococcus piscium]PCS04454.1 transcriptional regulator [Lactococcus piscium]
MTQKDISNKLEMSQPTYQRHEKSECEPNQEMIQKIANIFNFSIDYLFGNTSNKKTTKVEDDLEKSLDTFKSFGGKLMSDHDKDIIRKILRNTFNDEE